MSIFSSHDVFLIVKNVYMKEYFVYMLRCNDSSYYTGVTNDYQKRFTEHMTGMDPQCYTFSRRPLELVYVANFSEVSDAIHFEKQVKRWTRKKKEALINKDQSALERFSKRRGGNPRDT